MRLTKMLVASAAAAMAMAMAVAGTTQAHEVPNANKSVTVMTRNLYLGASLDPVLLAPDFPGVVAAVTQVWAEVQATDFNARVIGLADEIESAQPHLIGLQEASLWRIQEEGDILAGGDTPATEVAYDFVDLLLKELRKRGLRYKVAVSQELMDVELPDGTGQDIRLTDRDVVLVRRRGRHGNVKVKTTAQGVFETQLALPVGGEGGPTVTITRGWVSVDAKYRGKMFRFVNAHLEDVIAPPIQEAQAFELLQGPLDTTLPTICVGDFNSDALGGGTNSYTMLMNGGFEDTWTAQGGATWGHAPDLMNTLPTLTERLDLVLHDGSFEVHDAMVFGEAAIDITSAGLWPSDHAGVTATMSFRSD